jgi:hypothetical protein
MAKVYYVKDGSYPQNLLDPFGRRIALAELEHRLQDRVLHYLGSRPPEFNPHQFAHEARHVVLELDMEEPRGQRLTRTRYYLLAQLSPMEEDTFLFLHE